MPRCELDVSKYYLEKNRTERWEIPTIKRLDEPSRNQLHQLTISSSKQSTETNRRNHYRLTNSSTLSLRNPYSNKQPSAKMFWKSSLILVAAGIQTISAAALPPLTPRDDTQCAPGTQFYVCNLNNFRGCCSVDPCALTEGCPDNQSGGQCGDEGNRVYNPGMRIVGQDGPQNNDFHVFKSDDSIQKQDMYFSLPPDAKDCTLKWGVPGEAEREFTVKENGLVNILEVDANGNESKIGAADFTNWDKLPEPHDHLTGKFDCKREPKFRLVPVNNGEVFIAQNDHTGWFVEYKC